MILDERFLHTHPATLKWWAQRDKCEKCAHVLRHSDASGRYCVAVPKGRGGQYVACIDARTEGKRCGPDAKLFEVK